jgi:glycosyltransferase involved in cell wall biosynthesis
MYSSKICFVLPAKNEESTLELIIKKINNIAEKIDTSSVNIIVASDSHDKTDEICNRFDNVILVDGKNIGLGHAMYLGLKKAVSLNTEFICSIDSDGQVDLDEIDIFYDEILKGENQLILGSRFLKKDLIKYNYKFLNNVGTKLLRLMINYKTKLNITDSHGGIRIMRSGVAKKLKIIGDHTYVQETIIDAVENGYKVKEIESKWLKREFGDSKVVRSKIKYLFNVFPVLFIRCNLHKIIFYPLSILSFMMSFISLIFIQSEPFYLLPFLFMIFSFILVFFGHNLEQYKNILINLKELNN